MTDFFFPQQKWKIAKMCLFHNYMVALYLMNACVGHYIKHREMLVKIT